MLTAGDFDQRLKKMFLPPHALNRLPLLLTKSSRTLSLASGFQGRGGSHVPSKLTRQRRWSVDSGLQVCKVCRVHLGVSKISVHIPCSEVRQERLGHDVLVLANYGDDYIVLGCFCGELQVSTK